METESLTPPEGNLEKLRFKVRSVAPFLAAWLVAFMGILNVLSSLLPALNERLKLLEQISPLEVSHGSRLATVLAGFALILLSVNLSRRKQAAWLLTTIILIVSALGHLLKGLDYEEASIALIITIGLFFLRSQFYGQSDIPSVQQGLKVLIFSVLFTLAYGVTGFYLLDKHFSINFNFVPAIEQTLIMFTEFSNPGLEPITQHGKFFADSIYTVALFTLSYTLFMLVRPVLIRKPITQEERLKAQTLIEKYGQTPLARFALFNDKSYFFHHETVIAFAAKGSFAIALGDPIGPAEGISASLRAFNGFCSRNSWSPCFYQVGSTYLDIYKANGLSILNIGQEGIVDLSAFSLEGKAGKEFRNTQNRMNRLGHRAEIIEPPLSDSLLNELRAVSDEWLQTANGGELRFSLGWFDDEYIRNGAVAVIYTPENKISAFTNIVPEYQHNEVSLDLMRRRHHIENGTMDFLFASVFDWAKKKGYATFSLGLSALSGVGQASKDPAVEKSLRYIYENMDRFYNFQGLHSFKEKFHPQWEPRYFVYPNPAALPATAISLVRAHSGDNFIWAYLK